MLVPRILWDMEVIENKAFSLLFFACPAFFITNRGREIFTPFSIVFHALVGNATSCISIITAISIRFFTIFLKKFATCVPRLFYLEAFEFGRRRVKTPNPILNSPPSITLGKYQGTRYSQLSTFGLTFQICEMYEETADRLCLVLPCSTQQNANSIK